LGLWIVSPQFAAALIFIALGSWSIWRRLRRSRRSTETTAVVGVMSIVLTVAAALTLANCYFGYLPHVSDVANVVSEERNWPEVSNVVATATTVADKKWTHGVTAHLAMPDRGSGFGRSDALVWLPPQYFQDPFERFPVVYLFHGSPGVPGDWFRGGEAPQTAAAFAKSGHPVIIVAPRMSHAWLDDPECVNGIHEKVETHLLDDVIPTVDSTLRTIANRDGRTFGGMSAGGYCALNLGLRNRTIVSSIIDMSGLTGPTHAGGLTTLFGPDTPGQKADIRANSPAAYVPTLAAGPPMRIWMDTGSGDTQVLDEMRPVAAELASKSGIDLQFRMREGEHTFYVWVPALQEALPWSQGLAPGVATSNPSIAGSFVAPPRR
jgi:enterochelin esterase-like enzyme